MKEEQRKQNEQRRKEIKSQLAKMLEPAKVIDKLMKEVPHRKYGLAYRSLKYGDEFILHSNGFIDARYRDIDGILYKIKIGRILERDKK